MKTPDIYSGVSYSYFFEFYVPFIETNLAIEPMFFQAYNK